MQYTTVQSLTAFGSLTFDATTSANITLAVNATNEFIDNYFGYSLDDQIIGETVDIIDNSVIPKRNIVRIFNINEDADVALSITTSSDECVVSVLKGVYSLNKGVTSTDLVTTSGTIISQLNTLINASSLSADFTSVVSNGGASNALNIYDGVYQSESNLIEVPYASEKTQFNYRGNSKIIMTPNADCGTGRCVYRTGYTSVPSDIQFAALKFALLIYNNKSAVGTTTSESIGDYSYTISNLSNSSSDDSIVQIRSILNDYTNMDI